MSDRKEGEQTQMATVLLTTVDNPFDPIDEQDEWMKFDAINGYGTVSYLARVVRVHNEMTEAEYKEEVERAIDQIIEHDFQHIYKKIIKDD